MEVSVGESKDHPAAMVMVEKRNWSACLHLESSGQTPVTAVGFQAGVPERVHPPQLSHIRLSSNG